VEVNTRFMVFWTFLGPVEYWISRFFVTSRDIFLLTSASVGHLDSLAIDSHATSRSCNLPCENWRQLREKV